MFIFDFLLWLLIATIIQGVITYLIIRTDDGAFGLWIIQWIASILLSIVTMSVIPFMSIVIVHVVLLFWRAER